MVGTTWQRLAAAAACASVLGLAACKAKDGAGSADSSLTSTGSVARDSAAGATAPGAMAPGAATSPSTSPSGGALAITGGDPEIVQVLAVVDQGEIEGGRLAQRQARNAQVKSFARELVTSHQRSLQQDRTLAKTLNIHLMAMDSAGTKDSMRASGTDTSRSAAAMSSPGNVVNQLHTIHTQTMQQVKSLEGAAFDSAFVNAQVMGHQQVLDLLQRAQNQAQNAEVQKHLTKATTEVQDHLQRAQQLQQNLASGGTGRTGDTTSKMKSDTGRRGG